MTKVRIRILLDFFLKEYNNILYFSEPEVNRALRSILFLFRLYNSLRSISYRKKDDIKLKGVITRVLSDIVTIS
jgi:hypothetical protein